MAHGDFVWCDLSAFEVENAKDFYHHLFGWSYDEMVQPDGEPYFVASTDAGLSAGLFAMPDKFQKIGLPSFWMSYIQVDDARAAAELAIQNGGKVEVEPLAFGDGATIALMRDPLGAGFTVYQGSDLPVRAGDPGNGQMAWNALYVLDAGPVVPFYEKLFDWHIDVDPAAKDVLHIHNARGARISGIHEVADELRGKFQFWGVHFAVTDLIRSRDDALAAGGEALYEDAGSILLQDRDGAAFFISPS